MFIGRKQEIDPFAQNCAANEEKSESLFGFERKRRMIPKEDVGHAVGDYLDLICRHATADERVTHEVAGHPNFVELVCHRCQPGARQTAPFPGLNDDPMPVGRRSEIRRPLVRDMHVGWSRQRRTEASTQTLRQGRPLAGWLVLGRFIQRHLVAALDKPVANLAIDKRQRMQLRLRPMPGNPKRLARRCCIDDSAGWYFRKPWFWRHKTWSGFRQQPLLCTESQHLRRAPKASKGEMKRPAGLAVKGIERRRAPEVRRRFRRSLTLSQGIAQSRHTGR